MYAYSNTDTQRDTTAPAGTTPLSHQGKRHARQSLTRDAASSNGLKVAAAAEVLAAVASAAEHQMAERPVASAAVASAAEHHPEALAAEELQLGE